MRKALATAVVALMALAGCGNTGAGSNAVDSRELDESAAATPSPSPSSMESEDASPSPSGEPASGAVEITIEGDRISPLGDRIEVGVGEQVSLHVTSDRPGELHVHSTPEQELEYGKGETTLKLTIDSPGIVDVEDHEADVVILQLQVS